MVASRVGVAGGEAVLAMVVRPGFEALEEGPEIAGTKYETACRTMYETVQPRYGPLGNVMTEPVGGSARRRTPLSRERVLKGALAVADAGGLSSLTIRSLAVELGARPMSV